MATIVNDEPLDRTRLVNNRGIQVIKGGQTVDQGFFSGIVAAYANLVNNPVVLILGAFLLFIYIAEEGQDGPLKILDNILKDLNGKATAGWEKGLLSLLIKLVAFLIKYKIQFVQLGFAWLPYLVKPSNNSLYLSIVHSLLIFLMRHWNHLLFILLSQSHFIFVSLRRPLHKLFIIVLTIVFLFVEVEIGGTVLNPAASRSFRTVDNKNKTK
jgi:hypothetical protein